VGRDGAHAAPAAGDLDDDLRGAAHDGGANALAQCLRALLHGQAGQRRRAQNLLRFAG
jgi:hypothetical protein